MVEQAVSLNMVGVLSRANAASNALVTPETSRFLREILEKALANPVGVAPRWVPETWALLANVLVNDYLHSWNHAGRVELNRAEDAMQNALAIDPKLALAHHALGLIHRARGDHKAALKAFERAVELDGNFTRAHAQKGNELTLLGKPKEALPCVDEAIKLSPNDPALGTFYWVKGRAHFVAAQSDGTQYDPAIEALEKSVELLPTVWYNWAYLVSALTRRDVNKGKAILAQFARQSPFRDLTLEDVQRYERANPDDNDSIVKARQALREGLKIAGMIER
jgi:adenylate cyclase